MIARDITDKIDTHTRIFEQNKDLQQFTYMVAHNLRGPLSNAIGLVNVLGTLGQHTPEYEDSLAYVKSNLEQLERIMEDMNTILSVRNKEGLLEPEDVPLAEVAEQVLQAYRGYLSRCNADVHIDIPSDLLLRTNRAYLYSIISNLVSNAIKYRADYRRLQIRLSASQTDGLGQLITISDNGLGIDLQKAGENMFKLYKRFHPQHSGRGMGLYLVKTHVGSMGGRIDVSSQPDQGTTFTITLP